MRQLLFIPILAILISSCFSRFVMTEKELKEYYKDKPTRPVFFTIESDSVKLFCATAGADTLPALLLVHGAPGAWYGSRQMLEDSALYHRFQIIAMDRPGYNKSRITGRPKAFTSIRRQSEAIHEALRLNHSRHKAVIVGSSYGGPIAARLAIDYPDAFERVIMLAPALDPDNEKFWWFHPFIHHGPVRWLLPRFINHATDEKFAHISELRKLLPEWPLLKVPVTVVQGGADWIVDPANLDFAKAHIHSPGSRFIFLPKAGHLIRWQHADLVKRLLLHPGSDPVAGPAAGPQN